MQQRSKLFAAVALALAGFAANAASVDVHGYLRTQVGGTSEGGNLQCFKLDPAQAKYRLGNECDNYAEIQFDTNLGEGSNGVWAKHHLMLALQEKGAVDYESEEDGFDIAHRQNWVEFGGLFGSGMKDAKVWIGKRYYNRHDVHINDYYYWANTGTGAGIEDIGVGSAKMAFAYHQNGGNGNKDTAVKKLEARLYGLGVNPDGSLELAAQLIRGSTPNLPTTPVDESANDSTGYLLTAQHFQGNLLGGFNKFAVQYGRGNGAGGSWIPAYSSGTGNKKDRSYRVVEAFMWQTGNLSGMATAIYHDIKPHGGASTKWYSAGVRPQYNFNDNMSLAVELGYDQGRAAGGPTQRLTKLTVAPQWALQKGFWSRPMFRLFATYANWNEAARAGLNASTNNVFADKKHGFTYGAQVEAWW